MSLAGLGLAVLTLTACSSQPAATRSTAPQPAASAGASSTWQSSLKPQADTFYLGQGELPSAVVDETRASRPGRLILRVDCDRGRFAASITVDGTPQPNAFTCGDNWQEKFLTDIRKGQQVVIHAEGDEGTRFAMELVLSDRNFAVRAPLEIPAG
jgi:hypothetical protein